MSTHITITRKYAYTTDPTMPIAQPFPNGSNIVVEFTVDSGYQPSGYIKPAGLAFPKSPSPTEPGDPAPPAGHQLFIWKAYTVGGDAQVVHLDAYNASTNDFDFTEQNIDVDRAVGAPMPGPAPTGKPVVPAPKPAKSYPTSTAAPNAAGATFNMTFPHQDVIAVYDCACGLLAYGDILVPEVIMFVTMFDASGTPNPPPPTYGQVISSSGKTWIVKFDACNGLTGRVAVLPRDTHSGYFLKPVQFTILPTAEMPAAVAPASGHMRHHRR